jgi:hypothetical protein
MFINSIIFCFVSKFGLCSTNIALTNNTITFNLVPTAYDYGINWAISANLNSTTNSYDFIVNNAGNITKYHSNCVSVKKIQMENNSVTVNSHLMILTLQNYI